MSNTFSRKGQLHYCSLITALVDDQAIQKGIIAPQNVTPVLFYFINLAKNETLRQWLTDKEGNLKERQWLQCLNYLIKEEVFNANTKSKITDFLVEQNLLTSYRKRRYIQSKMALPVRPHIESLIKENLTKSILFPKKSKN